MNRYTCNQ